MERKHGAAAPSGCARLRCDILLQLLDLGDDLFYLLVMFYIGRVRIRELFRLVGLVIVMIVIAVMLMSYVQHRRSRVWVGRVMDFAGVEQVDRQVRDDLQVEQAKIAIASGRGARQRPRPEYATCEPAPLLFRLCIRIHR